MANTRQYFLFHATTPSLAANGGVFTVDEAAARIVATNLGTDVFPLQVRGGGNNDNFVWDDLYRNGSQVIIDADNTQYVEIIPGTYRIDPAFTSATAELWFEEMAVGAALQNMLTFQVPGSNSGGGAGGGGAADGNDFVSGGSLAGNVLTLTGTGGAGASVDLTPALSGLAHTAITSIDLQPTGNPNEYTVVIGWTDENGTPQTTTDATPVTLAGAETTTTLVDTPGTSFIYTNEAGTPVTVTYGETVTTFVDNLDGTYTYTSEDGTTTTTAAAMGETTTTLVDTPGTSFIYTNEAGAAVTVTYGETTTTLVDNGNGSFTYTNEAGAAVTFSETVSTLVDGGDGTYTHTSEDGTAVVITTERAQIAAAGDLIVGTAADTTAVLTMGSALQEIQVNAAGTALEYVTKPKDLVFDTIAAADAPSAHPSGTIYRIVNDPGNDGTWIVTGPSGSAGTGLSRT